MTELSWDVNVFSQNNGSPLRLGKIMDPRFLKALL